MAPQTPNDYSPARDQLANERTFLAWIRTALGVIGLGVITARFLEVGGRAAEILGLGLIFLGAVMLAYAVARFRRVTRMIASGHYQSAHWGPLLVAVACATLCVGAAILVVAAD